MISPKYDQWRQFLFIGESQWRQIGRYFVRNDNEHNHQWTLMVLMVPGRQHYQFLIRRRNDDIIIISSCRTNDSRLSVSGAIRVTTNNSTSATGEITAELGRAWCERVYVAEPQFDLLWTYCDHERAWCSHHERGARGQILNMFKTSVERAWRKDDAVRAHLGRITDGTGVLPT